MYYLSHKHHPPSPHIQTDISRLYTSPFPAVSMPLSIHIGYARAFIRTFHTCVMRPDVLLYFFSSQKCIVKAYKRMFPAHRI